MRLAKPGGSIQSARKLQISAVSADGIFLTSDARLPDALRRRLADFVSSAGVNKRAAEAARVGLYRASRHDTLL